MGIKIFWHLQVELYAWKGNDAFCYLMFIASDIPGFTYIPIGWSGWTSALYQTMAARLAWCD